ncbi:MAG: hypothetical protein VX834_08065 [Myxococcota bacterium]|nr:hypothetical protein [Myxococcota bacterium]
MTQLSTKFTKEICTLDSVIETMFKPFMHPLLFTLVIAWLFSACWCGSDGPPRPPKAMPEQGQTSPGDLTTNPETLP